VTPPEDGCPTQDGTGEKPADPPADPAPAAPEATQATENTTP
jgi:hypothetical protein